MKKLVSVLTLVMLFVLLPCTSLAADSPLEGKTLSVLGASISTYAGTSNGAAADTTNSTIRSNAKYYPNDTIPEVTLNDTWWMQVADDLGLRLLVNNAWSGSAILLERSDTVGAYVDRCVQLHDNTGDNAGEEPDIICIQMGFNDFSYGKSTLGTADIDYAALIKDDGYGTPVTTMEATAIMLDKIVKRYPDAEVYMFNHFKRIKQSAADIALMEQLNTSIETVCSRFGVEVVNLYTALTNPDHIGDGRLHPNRLGMDTISEAVKAAILSRTPAQSAHTVFLDLDGVTADYIETKLVLDGGEFTANLTVPSRDKLSVVVTMGGKDITASTYANGRVTINAVNADVTVTAKAIHEPAQYRWEFDGTDLVSVGEAVNALTKTEGTTTDGVFSKTRYSLEKSVVLQHDQPWVVEWKSEGTFQNTNGSSGARVFTSDDINDNYNARYIFKSNTNGLIAMGEKDTAGSHNYGIALKDHGIDWTALHTYRLENRIAADGSNMIWLSVDGEQIGPMNNYYVGTVRKNTTSDWLSGKDFVFPYMGTDTHGFTNASIEYIQVWEAGVSKSEVSDYKGKVISILSASTSTFAGYIPEDDGFNLAHRARYPDTSRVPDVTDVNQTWWMQIINELDAKLGINDSWAGSQVLNTRDSNSGDLGPDAAMASLTRIQNLGANGTPDVIFFFGAGNDIGRGVTLGSFDPDSAPTQVDLTTAKWDCLADAYVAAIMRLKHFYPDAQIVAMTTYAMPSYATAAKLDKYCPVIQAICEHYGVEYLDLRNSGVTFAMLPDKIHPNAEGMDKITEAVLSKLIRDISMDAEENTVYSVTHKLSAAQTSRHYYKGISAGVSFVETVSGKNVSVCVTMGGKDITASAYQNGSICIPEVTGDLVITARGAFDADGHLQQLPGEMCAGTNLWTALKPEQIYYTASGWGNTAAGTSWSITFPVKSGDRIWATSLGPVATNGSTANGVRVTWFNEDGTVNSISREVVYAEFAKSGYITAPDGAVALNLPMTNNQPHYTVYVLSAPHSNQSIVTAPTCTEEGYTTHTCAICDESYTDSKVAALGHSLGEWKQTKAPTEAAEGEKTRTCSRCKVMETESIPKLSHTHSYTFVVTAPTCTEKGYTTHTCKCGHSYADTYVDAKGHTEIVLPGKEATEEATGLTEGKKCSVCGTITLTQQTIPKKEHVHQYNFVIIDGLLFENCPCGNKTLAVRAVQDGRTVTVALLQELFPTTIYAARYDADGRMLEMHFAEVDGTEVLFEFTTDAGVFRVFFLTTDLVPWLNAVNPTKNPPE